jgi:two-component system sensor histidine kinase FlrB
MTSLPIIVPCTAGAHVLPPEDEQSLRLAFRSFAEAAESLERSYGMLREEVERLRGELAQSRAGLARSLEETCEIRQHLDRILERLPCGVLVESAQGMIERLNPEGRRLLGLIMCPGEAWLLSPSCSQQASPEGLRKLLERARSVPGEAEECFTDGNGSECWLSARYAAIPQTARAEVVPGGASGIGGDAPPSNESATAPASIFILRDISEPKRLVRDRERLRREQALAEMSAILAHEIRNPLGSLELFAGLLAGAGLSAECRQWVEHVQAGLRTLGATVNNVLHFHSLPAPERHPVDMGRLLEWAGGFLAPMAHRARVELRLRNHLNCVWVPADRHRLEQVLLNLVLNAMRAMPGGGWVEISGATRHRGAGEVVIQVSDSGGGIGPEEAGRLFEPGFSTHAGSPGLGLAVCRKIVEQHGGTLGATNRAGGGACFTLTLPRENAIGAEVSQPERLPEVRGEEMRREEQLGPGQGDVG